MAAAWGAWAAATSNPPARASGSSDGLRGHPASGGRLPSNVRGSSLVLKVEANLARGIQSRIARVAVGPSTVRGYPRGTVDAARRFLRRLWLRRFAVADATHFRAQLDRATLELVAVLPRGSRRWGVARKLLNLYLRDCVYSAHLRPMYGLGRAERHLELPLDSITARQLRKGRRGEDLPRWPGVGALNPRVSAKYQAIAVWIARQRGVRRVHLDVFWWSEDRD